MILSKKFLFAVNLIVSVAWAYQFSLSAKPTSQNHPLEIELTEQEACIFIRYLQRLIPHLIPSNNIPQHMHDFYEIVHDICPHAQGTVTIYNITHRFMVNPNRHMQQIEPLIRQAFHETMRYFYPQRYPQIPTGTDNSSRTENLDR